MRNMILRLVGALAFVAPLAFAGLVHADTATPGAARLLSEILAQAPAAGHRRADVGCQEFATTLPGANGGTASTSGQLCLNASTESMEMSSLLSYDSYSPAAGVTITGSVAVVIAIQGTQAAIAFHGGPLYYVVGGASHSVEFNQVAVGYDLSSGSMQATQVSGTIIVDGTSIPMDMSLAPYLL